MAYAHWKIDDLPWGQFAPNKVDPEILKIIKAAALVEANAHDYATYLGNIFPHDRSFQLATQKWACEETQHGEALGRWAELADSGFDFRQAQQRYNAGYRINVGALQSIRGSHAGELIARCIVETGTSSYYTALSAATDEPVLKDLCRRIAGDEHRHYKLFYGYLTDYLQLQSMSKLQRLKIGLSRIQETEDDELAYAYYAANAAPDAVFDRGYYTSAYTIRAYRYYRREHVERVVRMIFKACGFKTHTALQGMATHAAWWLMQTKTWQASRRAA